MTNYLATLVRAFFILVLLDWLLLLKGHQYRDLWNFFQESFSCLNFWDKAWWFLSLRVFIFIVISTTFWPICPLAFFRCLSNLGTYIELRTTSFIESTGVACSDSISHNLVQVLSIPLLLLACSQDWTCNLQMIVSLEA